MVIRCASRFLRCGRLVGALSLSVTIPVAEARAMTDTVSSLLACTVEPGAKFEITIGTFASGV
jgi:hypothetical protein